MVLVAGDHADKQTSIYCHSLSNGETTYLLFPASPEIFHLSALQFLSIYLLHNFLHAIQSNTEEKVKIKETCHEFCCKEF